jgi:hypothetical protein
MTREEMENAIVDDYVKMIIKWVQNSDTDSLREHVFETVYGNFKSMDLGDIQEDYESIKGEKL